MVTKDTPLKQFYEMAVLDEACDEGLEYMKTLERTMPMGAVVQKYLDDNQPEAWAYWMIYNYYQILDDALRELLISRVSSGKSAKELLKIPYLSTQSVEQLNLIAYGHK